MALSTSTFQPWLLPRTGSVQTVGSSRRDGSRKWDTSPRRLDGTDIVTWLAKTTFFDQPLSALPSSAARLTANLQTTGARGGHDLHYRTLQGLGVPLLGHLSAIDEHRAHFADDLAESVAFGDARWADTRRWGAVLGWSLWAPCASNWPAHATDRYTGPWNAKTKTPILLVGARYDAGTPYRNAQVAEQRLGNAVLLTLDGWGHPSFQIPSDCIDRARVRYLVKLITPRPGTHCQPDEVPFH